MIAKLSNFLRTSRGGDKYSEAEVSLGTDSLVTAPHFEDAGSESHPLETDLLITVPLPNSNGHAVVGYADPINTKVTGKGEKRIYGRDSSGNIVSQVWLKDDGSVDFSNLFGGISLESDGKVIINGVVFDQSGNVTSQARIKGNIIEGVVSVLAALKELVLHTHPAGTPPGNTGVNN